MPLAAELGVIIPAIDEAETLPPLLGDLRGLRPAARVLVVDGGSRDGTVAVARAHGAMVMRSDPGRARQMNAGAALLKSPWLLMLHADSRLDAAALRAIEGHMASSPFDAAFFGLAIDHPALYYRLIEGGQRIRVRRTGLVYGDQGLLVPRDLFFEVGPYPDEPVLEDAILARRLLRAGRLRQLNAVIVSSARRYEEEGRIRGWVRNAWLISRFLRGAAPAELAHRYPPRRGRIGGDPGPGRVTSLRRGVRSRSSRAERSPSASRKREARRDGTGTAEDAPRRMVLVFAKAPRPGAVKTRLGRTIGDAEAAALYRRMGRLVIDQLAGLDAAVAVCHDPPDAAPAIRDWLGNLPSRLWPQPSGDLGARISAMFERAFPLAERVVAIGTDALAVDRARVELAFAALESADAVLGPATDGGYYLLGLRAYRPELFADVRWSTSHLLEDTLRRARAAGAAVTFLPPESDIDRAEDLTPEVAARLRSASATGPAP